MFGCKINCLHHHNASNGASPELLIENLIKHNTCDIIIKPDPSSTTLSQIATYLASGLHSVVLLGQTMRRIKEFYCFDCNVAFVNVGDASQVNDSLDNCDDN